MSHPPGYGRPPYGGPPWPGPQHPHRARYPVPGWPAHPAPYGYAGPPQAPPRYQTPPPPRKRRGRGWIWLVMVVVVVVLLAGGGWLLIGRSSMGAPTITRGTAREEPTRMSPPADELLPTLAGRPTDPLWSYPNASSGRPVGGDRDTVMVAASAGLMAVAAQTGTPRWPTPIPLANSGIGTTCVFTADGAGLACAVGIGYRDARFLFLDPATGLIRRTITTPTYPGPIRTAAGLFITDVDYTTVAYRPDGTVVWQTDSHNDAGGSAGVQVYRDQNLVIIGLGSTTQLTRVLDAATGKPILQATQADHAVAFRSGFALAFRDGYLKNLNRPAHRIDFYDFSGNKTAEMSGDGYRLLDAAPQEFAVDRLAPSGFDVPLVYRPAGELAGVDPATGALLWSQPAPALRSDLSYGLGIGSTCVIAAVTGVDANHPISVRPCGTAGTNPFVERTRIKGFVGTDGKYMLLDTDEAMPRAGRPELLCLDAGTGTELWRADVGDGVTAIGGGLYSYRDGALVRWY